MKYIIIFFIFSLLSGCAFIDPRIAPTTRGDDQYSESVGNGRVLIVQTPFSDGRTIQDRCGMQKNGYGMDTASAICVANPTVWVAALFVDELRAAGFNVITEKESNLTSALKIQGILLKLFAEPTHSVIETDVHIKLIVSESSGFVAKRSFFVKKSVINVWGTTNYFQTSIDNATRQIVKDMVSSIVNLLNRNPELSGKMPHTKYISLGEL